MRWHITQECEGMWAVYNGAEKHWAQSAVEAVALRDALVASEEARR
jgi:hypothetical protein